MDGLESLWHDYDGWESSLNRLTVLNALFIAPPRVLLMHRVCVGKKVPCRPLPLVHASQSSSKGAAGAARPDRPRLPRHASIRNGARRREAGGVGAMVRLGASKSASSSRCSRAQPHRLRLQAGHRCDAALSQGLARLRCIPARLWEDRRGTGCCRARTSHSSRLVRWLVLLHVDCWSSLPPSTCSSSETTDGQGEGSSLRQCSTGSRQQRQDLTPTSTCSTSSSWTLPVEATYRMHPTCFVVHCSCKTGIHEGAQVRPLLASRLCCCGPHGAPLLKGVGHSNTHL